jgi:predicted permease
VDTRVVIVMGGLSLVTGMVSGLLPAWRLSRAAINDSLRAAERNQTSVSVARWRNALVVAEIALALTLLTGGGLLLRSFVVLAGVDLGFVPDRILAMNLNLPASRYKTADDRLRFFDDLATRVHAIPGVEAVGYANRLPLRGGWSGSIQIGDSADHVEVDLQAVSPGYFQTLGLALAAGRLFGADDRRGFPQVAVANKTFERKFFPGSVAVGQRIRRNAQSPWIEIVGVVADIRRGGKTVDVLPEVYVPAAQTDLYPVTLADFAVRASGDPYGLMPAIRQAVAGTDKDQPVGSVRTLRDMVDASVATRRFEMVLVVLFASVALSVTLIGLYGVVSYAVARRIPEFGVRIAMGATPLDIVAMVLRQTSGMVGIGIVFGVAGAYVLSRYLETLLFGIRPVDPPTFVASVALVALVALASSLVPARRASRVDPMIALRCE